MKYIVILISIILLSGCDNRKCLESHIVEYDCTYYIYLEHVRIPVKSTCKRTVCDLYEESE